METNQTKRFSFSSAAAQKPERQRFSFSQFSNREDKSTRQTPQASPAFSVDLTTANSTEQSLPEDSESTIERVANVGKFSGTVAKGIAQGAAKDFATLGPTLLGKPEFELDPSRFGGKRLGGAIFGQEEPFSAQKESDEFLDVLGVESETVRKRAPFAIAGLTALDFVTVPGKRRALQTAIKASDNVEDAAKVLRNADIPDEVIFGLRLDEKAAAAKSNTDVDSIFRQADEGIRLRQGATEPIVRTGATTGRQTEAATPQTSASRGKDEFFSFSKTVDTESPRRLSRAELDGSKTLSNTKTPPSNLRNKKTTQASKSIADTPIENIISLRGDTLAIDTGRAFENQPVKSISTEEIVNRDPSEGLDTVADLDEAQVQRAMRTLEQNNGSFNEPIRVKTIDNVIYVEDGKHRVEAARRMGQELVDVIQVPSSRAANIQPSRQATETSSISSSNTPVSRPKATEENNSIAEAETIPTNPKRAVQETAENHDIVAKKYSGTIPSKGGISAAHNNIEGLPPIENVTSKARKFREDNQPPIQLPEQTIFQWLVSGVQDQAERLGFYQKKLREAGRSIDEQADAYLQQEAFVGRAASRIENTHDYLGLKSTKKDGLFNRMRRDEISVNDLGEYMAAKNARTRNARVAKITEGKIPDGGSGFTNKQADEILKKYEGNENIETYAKEFRENVINEKLNTLRQYGLYNEEQIARVTAGEPDYVPAKVIQEVPTGSGSKGMNAVGKAIKSITGSARSDRTNAVIQSIADLESAIIQGEKNRTLQSLKQLIEQNPNKDLWEVKRVRSVPSYDEAGELQIFRQVKSKDPNTVSVYENGKEFEITIKNKELADVFTKNSQTAPIGFLMGVNNYLRAVNTFMAPEFMLTNAVRDLQTAVVTAGGEKGFVTAAKMVKDQPKAMKGIWDAARRGKKDGWAGIYNEMVESGGRTGWFDIMTIEEQTRKTSRLIERYNGTKTSDSLARAVDSTGQLISDTNEVAEMSIRVSAYKQLRDAGMSKTKAANYAKNMTVNFNKHGNWGLALNSLYLFANAGIQGSARILSALRYKGVRRSVYGIVASAYAANEMNERLNPEGWERIQDFEKERNFIMMLPKDGNTYDLPGISGDPRNGYYFKIPLPYGFNVFKVAGDAAYDVTNKRKTPAEAMTKTLLAFDAAFNPLSSGTANQFISPTFLDPFVSSWENKNWFGAPIMPEQPAFAPPVRDSDRYFSGARDLSVSTTNFLNRLTGGNEVQAGAIDISPETLDHMIDTLGGSLGNFIASSIDGTISTAKGDVPEVTEMPFVRKFIDQPFETGEQSTLFELLDESATKRLDQIQVDRFVDNTVRAYEMGQIDESTLKRVVDQFQQNNLRLYAGEALSLLNEGKKDEAITMLQQAPPGVGEHLIDLVQNDLEKELEKLQRESDQ